MLGRAGRKKPDKECRRYFVIKPQTASKRSHHPQSRLHLDPVRPSPRSQTRKVRKNREWMSRCEDNVIFPGWDQGC